LVVVAKVRQKSGSEIEWQMTEKLLLLLKRKLSEFLGGARGFEALE
jgi:hypothetical protein